MAKKQPPREIILTDDESKEEDLITKITAKNPFGLGISDVVFLKSGGRAMVISEVSEYTCEMMVRCVWHDEGGNPHQQWYNTLLLVRAPAAGKQ